MLSLRSSGSLALILLCLSAAHAAETISGRFQLRDHRGQEVTEASYNGKYRLVFFGFTRCPVICPTTMIEVTRVMKGLGNRADRVQPLFITIDPDNDTVDAIASYVSHFHPSVVGLTGNRQQIVDAAKSFNVTFGGTDTGTDGSSSEIYHSSYLYLMDQDGSFLDVFGYGDKAESILEKLDKYLTSSENKIHISDAWASEPVGAKSNVIAGFMCIENRGAAPVRITGASSEMLERIEIHEIVHEQGIVRMKRLDFLDVPPDDTVCLEPERTHFMLIGINEAIRAGADIVLQLEVNSEKQLLAVLPQRGLATVD